MIFTTYTIYLPIVIALTIYVARSLFKNSKVFMMDIFNGREEIAMSTNRLFEVGFYLLNIGFALLIMRITTYYGDHGEGFDRVDLMEVLSQKVGGFAIYLGVILFLNLFMFFRGKKAAKRARQSVIPQ